MTMPYDGELRDLLDTYRRQRAELGDMQREMREISATASAGQQAVRVTVDAQGDITDLAFPTGAYRRMAPAELASVLQSTIRLARADAARQMQEVLQRHNPQGGALDLVKGSADWSKLLPPEPPMPPQVRDALAAHRPGGAEDDTATRRRTGDPDTRRPTSDSDGWPPRRPGDAGGWPR